MLTSSSSPGSTDIDLGLNEQGQGTLAPDSSRPVGSWDHKEPLPWVDSGGEASCEVRAIGGVLQGGGLLLRKATLRSVQVAISCGRSQQAATGFDK